MSPSLCYLAMSKATKSSSKNFKKIKKFKPKKVSYKLLLRNIFLFLSFIKILISYLKLHKIALFGSSPSNKGKRFLQTSWAELNVFDFKSGPFSARDIGIRELDLTDYYDTETSYLPLESDGPILKCPKPQTIHWDHKIPPIHKLNPDKFLLPILNWGPNNQMTGLYESMALAVSLDRTFVMPPMFRHEFDAKIKSQPFIGVESRANPLKIREYLSTVPVSYMKEMCNNSISIGFIQHNPKVGSRFNRIRDFESATGMKIASSTKNLMIIPNLPSLTDLENWPLEQQNKGVVHDINDTLAWNYDYNSEEKCAVWILPYMSMKYTYGWQRQRDEQSRQVYELLRHIEMPKYITDVANLFIDTFYEPRGDSPGFNNFFAVHWRFDTKDWQRGCTLSGNSRSDLCNLIESITPKDVAGALLYHMAEKLDVNNHNMNNIFKYGLYIASPSDSRNMVNAVIEIMKGFWLYRGEDVDQLRYYSSSFLDFWLEQKFPNCENFNKDSETISLLEQGIVMESKSMLTSTSSSWSLRVTNKRKVDVGNTTSYPADRSLAEAIETYLSEDVENGRKGSIKNKMALEAVKREITVYISNVGRSAANNMGDVPMLRPLH